MMAYNDPGKYVLLLDSSVYENLGGDIYLAPDNSDMYLVSGSMKVTVI